jgi:hypothetical protein
MTPSRLPWHPGGCLTADEARAVMAAAFPQQTPAYAPDGRQVAVVLNPERWDEATETLAALMGLGETVETDERAGGRPRVQVGR